MSSIILQECLRYYYLLRLHDRIVILVLFLVNKSAAFTVFRTSGESPKAVSAEDILIAEGTATLELADQQVTCMHFLI